MELVMDAIEAVGDGASVDLEALRVALAAAGDQYRAAAVDPAVRPEFVEYVGAMSRLVPRLLEVVDVLEQEGPGQAVLALIRAMTAPDAQEGIR
jgi:hypothetical protein